jgi:hypothetical protein
VRIKSQEEIQTFRVSETRKVSSPSHQFGNLFNAYTKAINKSYQRSGSLFEKPFHRKPVTDDRYFTALVAYIHRNPQIHTFTEDFRDWPYSSYQAILSDKPTRLQRDTALAWFGGQAGFSDYHRSFEPQDYDVFDDCEALDQVMAG